MAEADLDRRSILSWSLGFPAAVALAARRALASECSTTQADFQGPMYVPGAPRRSVLAPSNEPGERVRIRGTVYGPDCRTPLPKTLLDVWHADAKGEYHGKERFEALVRDRFDSLARIGDVKAPILVLHGERDRIVPLRFGRALFDAAPQPKDAALLPGRSVPRARHVRAGLSLR